MAEFQGRANEHIVPMLLDLPPDQSLPEFDEVSSRIRPLHGNEFPTLTRRDASRLAQLTQAAYDHLLSEDEQWTNTSSMLSQRSFDVRTALLNYIDNIADDTLDKLLRDLRNPHGNKNAANVAKYAKELIGVADVSSLLFVSDPRTSNMEKFLVPQKYPENSADQAVQVTKTLYGVSSVLEMLNIPQMKRCRISFPT